MNLNNIKAKIYFFVTLLYCFNFCISFSTEPSKDPISLKEVGYGRLHTEYLNFYDTDRTEAFQDLATNEIMPLRKLWIDKFRNNESDNTLNIACIAFDFFNANEERLNEDLIYFKDHKQEMDKYYFISGRLPWKEIEKNENRTIVGSNSTKKIIQIEQIICLSQESAEFKENLKTINKIQEKKIKKSEFLATYNILDSVKQVFLLEFFSKTPLNKKALEYERSFIKHLTNSSSAPANIIHEDCIPITYARKKTLYKFSDYELIALREDEEDNKEFMFVHSEQLALMLLKSQLQEFFNVHFAQQEKYKKQDVKICVIYIYSYNTICARCSTSYLYDFHADNGLKSEIFKVLGEKIEIYNVAVTQVVCETNFLPNTQLPKPKYDFYDKDLFQNQGQLIFEPSFNNHIYQYVLPKKAPSEKDITPTETEDE